MRRLNISHVTEYLFAASVLLQPHRLLLRPRENHDVRIESSTLHISPAHSLQWKRDVLDNSLAVATFQEPTNHLRIASNVVLQHYEDAPLDFFVDDYAVTHPFDYEIGEQAELAPFRHTVYPTDWDAIHGWLVGLELLRGPLETFTLLDRMNRAIANAFRYQAREEPGVQSPARTLALNSGSCRDFAALFMEACRHLGMASRFVSGYQYSGATAAGNASTHAWAEVYLPGAGWKGFDPTGGEVAGNRHIAVAVARHPEAVPPVAGSFFGPADLRPVMNVSVQVSALSESRSARA